MPGGANAAELAPAFGAVAIAQIRAERAGIDHPVERGAATPEDLHALFQAFLKAGGTVEQMQAAASLAQGGAIDADTACRVNLLSAQATLALPEDARDRVIAMAYRKFKEMTEKSAVH